MATVYVIRAVGVGRIKVGVTDNLERRLVELRAMCPVPLEVVNTIANVNQSIEGNIHALLWEHHSHNEWFDEAGLPIALRAIGIVEGANLSVAEAISRYVPEGKIPDLIMRLQSAGAAAIAEELRNITGQSIMDRRFA